MYIHVCRRERERGRKRERERESEREREREREERERDQASLPVRLCVGVANDCVCVVRSFKV